MMKRSGSSVEVDIGTVVEGQNEDFVSEGKRMETDQSFSADITNGDESSIWHKSLMMLISNPPGSYIDSKVKMLSQCVH